MAVDDYIRKRFFPHLWCQGCGHGIIMNSLLRAIEELAISKNDIVMVSGIGCSARISGYVDFHSLHTIHGRALAFAAGVKMSQPSLNVIVPMGDGDALAIGGNHFIHAARRNMDITAIVMNNQVYGMTGGQFSPLSGEGKKATTAPLGNIDRSFDVVELSKASGASYVARGTTYHVKQMISLFKEALTHKGFSVVEILTQCPTYFGRKNKLGSATDMMDYFKEKTTTINSKAKEKNPSLIERGVFVKNEIPEDGEENDKNLKRARGGGRLMERCRLVFSGAGGQGVITAAIMLAEAAVLYEKLTATQTQVYGPEARGGATRSDVIISDSDIYFPKVTQPNILVCLTQEAYMKFYDIVRPGGLLLTDIRYVTILDAVDSHQVQLPMYTTVMEELGSAVALSTCMLGALLGLREIVSPDAIQKVFKDRIPSAHYDMNVKAMELGLALGREKA